MNKLARITLPIIFLNLIVIASPYAGSSIKFTFQNYCKAAQNIEIYTTTPIIKGCLLDGTLAKRTISGSGQTGITIQSKKQAGIDYDPGKCDLQVKLNNNDLAELATKDKGYSNITIKLEEVNGNCTATTISTK